MRHALAFFLLVFAFSSSNVQTYDQLVHAIREARAASEKRVEQAVEQEKVREAWEIGRLIDEHVLLNKERAKYGERVLQRLSFDLGISKRELHYMVEFARSYPIYPTSGKLSWAHYRDLLAVNDPEERNKVEHFAEDHKLPASPLLYKIPT